MDFSDYEQERHFRDAWEMIDIVRPVPYSLFTFGDSVLPYYLVCRPSRPDGKVSLRKGEVTIARPMIITPDSARPEFSNFFEEDEDGSIVEFLMARTAAFSNLKFANHHGPAEIISDDVEEAVAKLNRQLDDEEENHVAVIVSPPDLAGVAVLRYAAERVWSSASDNVQELRERGFLP